MTKSASPDISIVMPCFNEADSITTTAENVLTALSSIQDHASELIIVNDGSSDDTTKTVYRLIKRHASDRISIKYVSLTRNFGKEAAVLAGYMEASGTLLGCLDADGQHPPSNLPGMITKLVTDDSIDVVIGVRIDQTHKKIGFMSSAFYRLSTWSGNKHLIRNGTDFRIMRRHVIESYLTLQERNRINRDLMDWMGFPYAEYPFKPATREAGKASYSVSKLVSLAIDGIIASGTRPLMVLFPLGLFVMVAVFIIGALLGLNALVGDALNLDITIQGAALLVILFFFGIVLTSLGIIALYISRTFTEVQSRPHYIINSSVSKNLK